MYGRWSRKLCRKEVKLEIDREPNFQAGQKVEQDSS